nr:hypothetical protein XNW1_4380004 [Xenorhabdus nematophila str. Websteri]
MRGIDCAKLLHYNGKTRDDQNGYITIMKTYSGGYLNCTIQNNHYIDQCDFKYINYVLINNYS